jgi:hydrogenase maturation protease
VTRAAPVLIGGVGYRNLRDHSAGVLVTDALDARGLPPGVAVEDLSYNPVAVHQRLEDDPPGAAVVVGAVERPGRRPGTVTAYRWDGALPGPEEIQRAVAEAVTGVISLDNTLVVVRHFGGWPDDLVVLEIEPALHEFGDELSPAVAQAVERAAEQALALAADPAARTALPRAPLGGRAGSPARADSA